MSNQPVLLDAVIDNVNLEAVCPDNGYDELELVFNHTRVVKIESNHDSYASSIVTVMSFVQNGKRCYFAQNIIHNGWNQSMEIITSPLIGSDKNKQSFLNKVFSLAYTGKSILEKEIMSLFDPDEDLFSDGEEAMTTNTTLKGLYEEFNIDDDTIFFERVEFNNK